MSITVKTDLSGLRTTKKRLQAAQYNLGNQIMSDMDQFVPYKAGHLSGSAHLKRVGDGKFTVSYTTPYARKQFYGVGIKNHTRTVHPMATSRWDLAAKSRYMNDWVHAFQKGVLK
ncbi:minor capsid protein [Ligilactobacillus equi]|uniref:Minor capsid protein n=1 Tax=Ligilactobacillus equi DPC 6820 TaxID=1392007 RepID=V7HYX7_9LACO|nr:minor capsid protein [Ligilactobacillus equi]ETA75092.1 hypothetical protein LEQ_1150 [Ligilactobacillus equi DPC 6820]